MAVYSDNNITLSGLDTNIQGGSLDTLGIGQQFYMGVELSNFLDNSQRTIGRAAINDQDFQAVGGIILGQDCDKALPNKAGFVENRQDDGYKRL